MSFFEGKKVVVTGGSGFLGSNYIEGLVKRGADVYTHIHHKPLQTKVEGITDNHRDRHGFTHGPAEGEHHSADNR